MPFSTSGINVLSLSDFARAHVLIVDDERSNRLLLREVCKRLRIGIIDEAEDGATAWDFIARFRPDLVLLDIRMPGMDGYEIMRRIRAYNLCESVAVLVLTSLQSDGDLVRCFELGATDVVRRPFHVTELEARLHAHLRSAIAARVLFDYRNRIQAHIEITHAFLNAILPTPERAQEIAGRYGLICSAVYRPHDEIGGDLWSLIPLCDDELAVVLVDASAHGLAGAINALRVDCLVQENHDYLRDPGVFLEKLDGAMAKISFGQLFAGAVALVYNRRDGSVRYAGSNIPSPLIRDGEGVAELKTRGLPLGSGMVHAAALTAVLPPGGALALASDGWLDGDAVETVAALRKACSRGPCLAENLVTAEPPPDDLTLIVLQRR